MSGTNDNSKSVMSDSEDENEEELQVNPLEDVKEDIQEDTRNEDIQEEDFEPIGEDEDEPENVLNSGILIINLFSIKHWTLLDNELRVIWKIVLIGIFSGGSSPIGYRGATSSSPVSYATNGLTSATNRSSQSDGLYFNNQGIFNQMNDQNDTTAPELPNARQESKQEKLIWGTTINVEHTKERLRDFIVTFPDPMTKKPVYPPILRQVIIVSNESMLVNILNSRFGKAKHII